MFLLNNLFIFNELGQKLLNCLIDISLQTVILPFFKKTCNVFNGLQQKMANRYTVLLYAYRQKFGEFRTFQESIIFMFSFIKHNGITVDYRFL